MSGVYGTSDEELLKNRVERMKETTQDLTIQMKMQTFMKQEAAKEQIERERNEQAYIQMAIKRDELNRLIQKAESESQLNSELAAQVEEKNKAKSVGLLKTKIR